MSGGYHKRQLLHFALDRGKSKEEEKIPALTRHPPATVPGLLWKDEVIWTYHGQTIFLSGSSGIQARDPLGSTVLATREEKKKYQKLSWLRGFLN